MRDKKAETAQLEEKKILSLYSFSNSKGGVKKMPHPLRTRFDEDSEITLKMLRTQFFTLILLFFIPIMSFPIPTIIHAHMLSLSLSS